MQLTEPFTDIFDTDAHLNEMQPVTGDHFAYSGTPNFTLTASGALLTCQVDGTYLFLLSASVASDPSELLDWALGIAINDDLVGVDGDSAAAIAKGVQLSFCVIDGRNNNTMCMRRATLTAGDTVRPVANEFGTGNDLVIASLTLTVIKTGP